MWHVAKLAALAIIFSISAPDVQEQNNDEGATNSPASVKLESNVKIVGNYPDPF